MASSQKRNSKKAGNFSRWFARSRRLPLVGAVLSVAVVGIIGYHFVGQSHANGTWYFWASRQGNLWTDAWLHTNGTPYGSDGNGTWTLPVGYWAVSCQLYTNWTKTYGGYSNEWWVRLSDGQGGYSGLWVNEVFLSLPSNGPGGRAPGIRTCTDSN